MIIKTLKITAVVFLAAFAAMLLFAVIEKSGASNDGQGFHEPWFASEVATTIPAAVLESGAAHMAKNHLTMETPRAFVVDPVKAAGFAIALTAMLMAALGIIAGIASLVTGKSINGASMPQSA